MAELFLHLPADEQAQIYRAMAPRLSRAPIVLEKDVWVCWVLQALFTMPQRLPMAFKGGTSLSKVFGIIARFSEDVDITLDYRGLGGSFDPFADGVSRSRLRRFREDLTALVRDYAYTVVVPSLTHLAADANIDALRIEASDDGEQVRVYYPAVLDKPESYIGNSVLIEFGGRNITEPHEEHVVRPDIAPHITGLVFPESQVTVLTPARTFWEKATLLHVECQRNRFQVRAERLSRHWYDLAMLADSNHGQTALADRTLLADVIKHKKAFYNTSYANYDACLSGQFRLVPAPSVLSAIQVDFQQMIDAGMFFGATPDFDTIVNRLRALETAINQ